MNLGGLGVGAFFVIVGGLLAYAIWDETPDHGYGSEYPFFWWVSWGFMGFGMVAALASIWSVSTAFANSLLMVGLSLFVISALFGLDDGEWRFPSAPFGLACVAIWVLLHVIPSFPISSETIGFFGVMAGVAAIVLGGMLHTNGQSFYDTAYMFGFALVSVSITLMFNWVRTPLDNVNEILVPEFNQAVQQAESNQRAYDRALENALQQKEVIRLEFVDLDPVTQVQTDGTLVSVPGSMLPPDQTGQIYLDQADIALEQADQHLQNAREFTAQAGGTQPVRTKYTEEDEKELLRLTGFARNARSYSQQALDQLNSIGTMAQELAKTWRRTILWTEIGQYWPNESSDSNHRACYYGVMETYSLDKLQLVELPEPDVDGNTYDVLVSETVNAEMVISDAPDIGQECGWLGCPDSNGVNWKIFTSDDYNWMVSHSLIIPMDVQNPNETQIGDYLCTGDNPIIQEGTTFVKESGTLRIENEDQEDTLVGNYDYGVWCEVDPITQEILMTYDEGILLPMDRELQWCWYVPDDGDVSQLYTRELDEDTNTYVYIHRGRRCFYCSHSRWSGGGGLAPDTTVSKMTGSDITAVRGPADIGGGPTAGK